MADDWQNTTVGKFTPFTYGKSLPQQIRNESGLIPVYGSNGIVGYHNKVLTEKPTIIIGRKGTVGTIHYSKKPCWVIDTAFCITDVPDGNLSFAYYLLKNLGLDRLNSDSAVPGLNRDDAHFQKIKIPPLPEQKAIASILSSLDDKIELNQQMNRTLEAQARVIFKSWFVDFDPVRAKMEGRQPAGMNTTTAALFPDAFEESQLGMIPKGWRITALDDITEFVLGGDWGKDSPVEEFNQAVYCIRGADIPNLQNAELGKMPVRYLKSSSLKKRSLKSGDIVIEISGGSPTQSTGRPVLITEELLKQLSLPLVCSNFCRIVRLEKEITPIYVYLWLRLLYSLDAFLQYENGTTGIKNFAYSVFSSQETLIIPPLTLLVQFESIVNRLFVKRQVNGLQSQNLVTLRDFLLPKLMSGEIRVKEAEKMVA
jgi:type I restriction enzyme, S subunit